MSSTAKTKRPLVDLAITARTFSHSPYSNKKVGAAIEFTDGSFSTGCNIENASYGATVCAERVAIWKRVSESFSLKSKIKIKKIVVAVDEKKPWPPCGMCLQVIAEFAGPKTEIICTNLKGQSQTYSFKDLLPQAFEGKYL
jgi:cytidine deaminase